MNAGTFGFRSESWAAGNLNLTGASVNLNGGTFWVGRTGSAAALTWGSGAINLGGDATIQTTNYINMTGRYLAGSGNVTINSNNSYDLFTSGATNSGTVALTGGNLRLRGGATGTGKIGDTAWVDLTNTNTTLTLNGGDGANANNETIGYLTGGASTFVLVNNNNLTLSGNNLTAATYSGQITYNNGTGGSLIKNGSGVQILAGANGYTGATTINGGELRMAATGTLTETSGITVTAGTLVLEAADRIVNTADLTLSGGTFNVGGFSETLDILTTTTGSILDFGSGTSTLLFASLASYSGVLAISNWTPGSDSLRFTSGTGLDAAAFSVNGGSATILNQGSYFEVVPEPATWALLAGSLTTMMIFRRRRRMD